MLVGTASVENSEHLSGLLVERSVKVPHEVLNAKNHEREAHIVAMAGSKGAVTVSTNMAGRGTDIKLGGNFEYRLSEALRGRGASRRATSSAWTRSPRSASRSRSRVGEGRGGDPRARWPLRARHRAPRGAAHRQPAPRPDRPPGQRRREPLLPVAPGPADADLLPRLGRERDGAPRHERGPAHRVEAWSRARWPAPRRRSRTATSRSARTSSSTTR